MSKKNENGFWFGMIMGGAVGSAALYFLGTKDGREKLRNVIDAAETMDLDSLENLKEKIAGEGQKDHSVVSNITNVLDKIESALPTKKEVQKYFVKDGKIMK